MLKSNLPKFVLLVLSFGVLSVVNVTAQTTSCALQIEAENSKNAELIKDTSATAVNVKTRQVYRSRLRNGMPYFSQLPEGRYNLTVTKAGFKQSKDIYEVVCDEAENGVLSALIPLVNGSPRQIHTVQRNVLAIRAGEKFTIGSEYINAPVSGVGVERIESNNQPINIDGQPRQSGDKSRSVPKIINKGIVNGSAISLPKPTYPPAAKAVRAAGTVSVQVTIDEEGNVISASAVGGHPLLHQAAVGAARQAKFRPTLLSGTPVKVTGIITYLFVAQ